MQYESEMCEDNIAIKTRKQFIPPVYLNITGYNRIKTSELFNVIAITDPKCVKVSIKQNDNMYAIKAANKIIIVSPKMDYPCIDGILLTLKQ